MRLALAKEGPARWRSLPEKRVCRRWSRGFRAAAPRTVFTKNGANGPLRESVDGAARGPPVRRVWKSPSSIAGRGHEDGDSNPASREEYIWRDPGTTSACEYVHGSQMVDGAFVAEGAAAPRAKTN